MRRSLARERRFGAVELILTLLIVSSLYLTYRVVVDAEGPHAEPTPTAPRESVSSQPETGTDPALPKATDTYVPPPTSPDAKSPEGEAPYVPPPASPTSQQGTSGQSTTEISIGSRGNVLAKIVIWGVPTLLLAGFLAWRLRRRLRHPVGPAPEASHPLNVAGVPPASGTAVAPSPVAMPAAAQTATPTLPPPPPIGPATIQPAYRPGELHQPQGQGDSLLTGFPSMHRPGEVFSPGAATERTNPPQI